MLAIVWQETAATIFTGRNLTLGRRCSQRLCSKRCHIPEKKNIFNSYEKFAFNFWLMLNIDTSSAFQNLDGRGGTSIPIHSIMVCFLNLVTRCSSAVRVSPQPFFNRVGKRRCLPNGMLGGNQQAVWTFLEEKKYLPLIRLELRIFQPVATSPYWPRYFCPFTEGQDV
jgi:hypothetical protein